MNRTTISYLEKFVSLVCGQITRKGNLHFELVNHSNCRAGRGILRRKNSLVRDVDVHALKIPLFPFGVHLNRDAGTRT